MLIYFAGYDMLKLRQLFFTSRRQKKSETTNGHTEGRKWMLR